MSKTKKCYSEASQKLRSLLANSDEDCFYCPYSKKEIDECFDCPRQEDIDRAIKADIKAMEQ